MKKYKYTGSEEKHMPTYGLTVKPGDIVEVADKINHPEFEEVNEQPREKKEVKKEKE